MSSNEKDVNGSDSSRTVMSKQLLQNYCIYPAPLILGPLTLWQS